MQRNMTTLHTSTTIDLFIYTLLLTLFSNSTYLISRVYVALSIATNCTRFIHHMQTPHSMPEGPATPYTFITLRAGLKLRFNTLQLDNNI